MNDKTQTERLIEEMEQGRTFHMVTAFHELGIQDLRKRLSDIRELGYNLRHFTSVYFIAGAERVDIRVWGLKTPLQAGDFVKVIAAPVHPTGSHPLRGKIGTVVKKQNNFFHVADAQGRVFGKFRHKDLLKIADYGKGQAVKLTQAPLEVEGYEPQSGTYILSDGSRKFFAEAPLLRPVHAPQVH